MDERIGRVAVFELVKTRRACTTSSLGNLCVWLVLRFRCSSFRSRDPRTHVKTTSANRDAVDGPANLRLIAKLRVNGSDADDTSRGWDALAVSAARVPLWMVTGGLASTDPLSEVVVLDRATEDSVLRNDWRRDMQAAYRDLASVNRLLETLSYREFLDAYGLAADGD